MINKIKILHLEDSLKDSELIQSIIESGEIGHEYFFADNEEDFINTLETENIDIILSDFSLPDYNGNQALKVAREKFSRMPFIFVSGTMGEDAAINAMLNGATDYVLKNKLERLVPAITRAINEHKLEINRSQAVAELKESEERFKAIFNDAPMGIALVDSLTGKIHNVNPMFAKIAGRTIEEMINIDWMSITHPDDIQLDMNNMAKLVAGEINGFRIEKRYVHPDGSFVWINMTVSQILYKDKSHLRHLCMIEDITERKRAEQELVIANKELLFQNEEKEKRAAELNIANKELAFQNEEKEKRAAELIIANEELAFQNIEKEKRASELFVANIELLFQNEEKEKRADELIIAKEKAEESDRLKSAFLANMSHEIRTPMNGIMGFAELLKEPELSGDEKEYFIGVIEKSGIRMLNIISDILNISKIESGQMNVTISETNVNEQVESIYTLFKPEVEEKGMQIFFKNSLPDTKSVIKTDREKIHAILTNLVKNAIKFTNTGSVEFGYCLKTPTELEFFVKDTGIGIHPEQLEIIFERFRQVSESLNRKYEGAGLGLSISKAFVEMLGGKIWVESELGKGTTIYFTIPYDIVIEENHINKNLVLNKSYLNDQHASVEKSSK